MISAVTPYTGNSKVATLDMTATKYPAQAYDASDSSTYTKILSEDAAGFISSSYNLFTVEKAGYEINNLGRIIKSNTTPENYNGTLSYTEDNITISLSAVDVYSAQDNLINIKAFADKDLATETELTSSVLATNWDIRVYSAGTNVSSNATYFAITNTTADRSVNVKSGIPAGTPLQIYVSFDYNGKTYGGSFDLNVKEVIAVDAAGFAALYSSLPATGTYTIKITGNSLSGIKSNLVNGSRYINLDLSEVSPSAFVDEVLRGSIVIKSLKLPEGLTSLPRSAFSGCSGLETVELPSTLTTIGETAFANCGSLSSITIPQSLTTIGKESFKNCTSLTTITIPSDVSSIGLGAFLYCTNLTSIVFSDSTSLWDGYYSTGTIFVSGQRFNNSTQNATVLISNADKYFVKQ